MAAKKDSTRGDEKRAKNRGKQTKNKQESSKSRSKEVKAGSSRSNPQIEYSLADANAEERTLVIHGTINDRINTLSLLCTRNPSADNYKQLLYFTKDQRHDVIYSVLKNLRDLLKEQLVDDNYIKCRIIKSYEMGAKNQYIKDKVVEMIGVLIRAGIYEEEFITILTERLMEKGKTLRLVQDALKSVFSKFEELIIANVEDFYYKNDNFRSQYYVLRFLRECEPTSLKIHFDFYNQALATVDETYFENEQDILINQIISGLASSYADGSAISRIDRVRNCSGSPQSAISALNLLIKIKDEQLEKYVLRIAKSMVLRGSPYEPAFLNHLVQIIDEKLVDCDSLLTKLINSSLYQKKEYLVSLILICYEHNIKLQPVLWLLAYHYDSLISFMAISLIKGKTLKVFDPFDKVALGLYTEESFRAEEFQQAE